MKVRELINQLEKHDQEAEVPIFFEKDNKECEFEIDYVDYDIGEKLTFQPIIIAHIVDTRNKEEEKDKHYPHVIEL